MVGIMVHPPSRGVLRLLGASRGAVVIPAPIVRVVDHAGRGLGWPSWRAEYLWCRAPRQRLTVAGIAAEAVKGEGDGMWFSWAEPEARGFLVESLPEAAAIVVPAEPGSAALAGAPVRGAEVWPRARHGLVAFMVSGVLAVDEAARLWPRLRLRGECDARRGGLRRVLLEIAVPPRLRIITPQRIPDTIDLG